MTMYVAGDLPSAMTLKGPSQESCNLENGAWRIAGLRTMTKFPTEKEVTDAEELTFASNCRFLTDTSAT